MFKVALNNLKEKAPIVHNISNYVSMRDCANITLAAGGYPIMADEFLEMEDIAARSRGLCINLGMLNEKRLKSILAVCKKMKEYKKPIILDPTGVGTSNFRLLAAKEIVEDIGVDIIKGNISEIKALLNMKTYDVGIDVSYEHCKRYSTFKISRLAQKLSEKVNAVVVVSGEKDIVTDGGKTYCVKNGMSIMSKVTGMGCQCSSLIAALASANRENMLASALTGAVMMGIAGEIAALRMKEGDGYASYGNYVIDAISNMDTDIIEKMKKVEKVQNVHIDVEKLKLYGIADSKCFNSDKELLEVVEIALSKGMRCIQLRDKQRSSGEMMYLAKEVRELCTRYDAIFIVNDYIELAVSVNADGVHIGQNDISLCQARKMLGDEFIIGVSVHDKEEALKAQEDGADYLGAGAVFQTKTKSDTTPISMDEIDDICDNINIPIIAIGGIDERNAVELYNSKINGIAVATAIFGRGDVAFWTEEMMRHANIILEGDE